MRMLRRSVVVPTLTVDSATATIDVVQGVSAVDAAPHVHRRTSVALITGRPHAFTVAGKTAAARVEDVIVAPAGDVHCNHSVGAGAVEYTAIEFDPALIGADIRQRAERPDSAKVAAAIRALADQVLTVRATAFVEPSLVRFVVSHAARFDATSTKARWRRCLRFIQLHLGDPIALADLAELTGLRTTSFCRAFSRDFGLPPHRYIVSARLDRARSRLLDGHPLADVAAEVGFSDQSHLTRHFRRQYGTTPGRFCRQVKNVQDRFHQM